MNKKTRLLSEKAISTSICKAAEQLSKEYAGQKLHFIIVMKGALFFAADLIREISIPCTFSYIQCSSYTGKERREVSIVYAEEADLSDKAVIVLDDIFDTGNTMRVIVEYFSKKNPLTLKTMALLEKRTKHKTFPCIDYALNQIDDAFVIGYGLDMFEYERNLKEIYTVEG